MWSATVPRVMSAWGTWSVTSVDGGGVRRAGVCARDARDTGAACVKLYTLDMLKSDNIAV